MRQPLSQIIENIFDPQRGTSSYGEVVDEIGTHGLAAILVLFALPSALPIPAAGYSTLLSIPLFLIGFRLLLGHQTLWLPSRWRERRFDPQTFSRKLVDGMLRLVLFVENFTSPRLSWLTTSMVVRIALGVLILVLAASMALPIPGTNTAPALGIFLLGFALLEKDGLLLLLGVLASLVALIISITIVLAGYQGYLYLKDAALSLIG
ncbi:MAG: exopolysaccharide biosynthesis protein [Hyphomicrobiaceae bacterium]